MTFLQLCQRFRQEARIAGTGPSTVVSQTGEMARIVSWVADAWFDIQSKHPNWRFLRSSVSFATVNAQATYTTLEAGITAGRFGSWDKDSFRVYKTSTGTTSECPLTFQPYDDWRNTYQFGAMRTSYSQPQRITVTPSNGLGLGPVPASGYTIVGDYQEAPVTMTLDADVPSLPVTHSPMLIVWRGLMKYAASEEAAALYALAKGEYDELYDKLVTDQLPTIGFGGGPFA